MEFCLQAILVAVVGLTLCFTEPAVSQRGDPNDDSAKLPQGLKIDAKAVEEKYGGINITWDIQPANDVVGVMPLIETKVGGAFHTYQGFERSFAKNSQCFSRPISNGTYRATLAINFVNSSRSYIYDLGILPSVNIGKSLNFRRQCLF